MSNEAMSHEEVIQSIPAYAVGGLDDEETAAVEEHLRGCETCRRELASYEPLLGGLGLAAPESSPPEGARERLLERLEEQRQGGNVRSLWSARRAGRSRQRLPWMAAAASLLVALFLGGAAWQMHGQVSALNEEVAAQQEAMNTGRDMMGRADLEVSEVLNSESGVRTRIYHTPDGDLGMFVFDHLPELAEDEVYQLWVETEDGMESEGTFRPMDEERGSYLELIEPPEGFDEYEAVGVATAPEGGVSEAPPESEMIVWETVGEAADSAESEASNPTDPDGSQAGTPESRTANGNPGEPATNEAPATEAAGAGAPDAEAPDAEIPDEGAPESSATGEDPAARAPLTQPTLPEQPADARDAGTEAPETSTPAPDQKLSAPDSPRAALEAPSGDGGTLDGGSESPGLDQYGDGSL